MTRRIYKFESGPTDLFATGAQVALLTRPQRVTRLIAHSGHMLDLAQEIASAHQGPREIAGTVGLFSGGNDSTVLSHLMRPRLTHFAHANKDNPTVWHKCADSPNHGGDHACRWCPEQW